MNCEPPINEAHLLKRYLDNLGEKNLEGDLKNVNFEEKLALKNDKNHGFLADLQKFIKQDELKDFTIIVGGHEFKVHKLIFAARSEIFAKLIKNNPKSEDLVLQDISVEIFECVLSYVYTDQLPDTQNLHEVFEAAEKLKIEGLKVLIADLMLSNVKNEEELEVLFEILSFANKFDHDELRLKAFEKIKRHFPNKTLKDELAGQLEKLKKIIDAKILLDQLGRQKDA